MVQNNNEYIVNSESVPFLCEPKANLRAADLDIRIFNYTAARRALTISNALAAERTANSLPEDCVATHVWSN